SDLQSMTCKNNGYPRPQMGLKKKKIAARKHAPPLGAKPPLSLNPRNAPDQQLLHKHTHTKTPPPHTHTHTNTHTHTHTFIQRGGTREEGEMEEGRDCKTKTERQCVCLYESVTVS